LRIELSNQSKNEKLRSNGFPEKTAVFSQKVKMASRFVQIECPIEERIQKQANKNTVSKTTRDLALLKEFLKAFFL
jgi:adenylate cyclase class IV